MSIEFNNKPAKWNNEGVEPSNDTIDAGFSPGDKPPAAWINWQFNKTYNSISELQDTVSDIDTEVKKTIPISKGGTGATNVSDAWANMQIYTTVGQLGLTYPCTTVEICNVMPNKSIFVTNVESMGSTITDVPLSWGMLNVIKFSNSRKKIEFTHTLNTECERYFGGYNSGDTTITWKRVPYGTVSIGQGGTGATTASAALTNLGAVPTSRTINSKALTSNITLHASDVGAAATSHNHSATDITSGTLPIENGGTGANEIYAAQNNLGLMKRYTNFGHLTLQEGYTFKDVFLAMADNTYIEFKITTSLGITVCPTTSGLLKIYRADRNFGYAEFWSNPITENSKWVGSLHSDRGFTWNKVYTENKTIPIENGGTGATTTDKALTNLKLYTTVGDLGLSYPCTTVDIVKAMPTNSEVKISVNKRGDSITDLPIDYCLLTVRYNALNRYQILCTNMTSTGSEGTYIGNYVRNTSISWEKIFTDSQVLSIENGGTGATTASAALSNLGAAAVSHNHAATDITSGTLPIDRGGTGANEIYAAQNNLGLMKRYKNFDHLTLSDDCTITDILNAMASNTYIETAVSTVSKYHELFPGTQGFARLVKVNADRSYAEFRNMSGNSNNAGLWIGYYRPNTEFTGWKKVYTSFDTVPIANGGTGATTASAARSNLGALSVSDIQYGIIRLPANTKVTANKWTRCIVDITDFAANKKILGVWGSMMHATASPDGEGVILGDLIAVPTSYHSQVELAVMIYNNHNMDGYLTGGSSYLRVSYVSTS